MKTTRYIAKCRCGAHTSTLATNVGFANADMGAAFYDEKGESGAFGGLAIRCRACGAARSAKAVRGVFSTKHQCSAKCMTSTGFQCECSCAGKNHGASHAA